MSHKSNPGMPEKTTPGMSKLGMSGMSPERGRPAFTDKSQLKTATMTICLTSETHLELCQLAAEQNQRPAAMGRILIEIGVENGNQK